MLRVISAAGRCAAAMVHSGHPHSTGSRLETAFRINQEVARGDDALARLEAAEYDVAVIYFRSQLHLTWLEVTTVERDVDDLLRTRVEYRFLRDNELLAIVDL